MAYTVDEVSDLLDVPRPTLYRYLREYSITHNRRGGKIYVPEESFDRIKEVRELHKEGLGTESVRMRLLQEEESGFEVEGLKERLDRISEALENLQGDPRPAGEAIPAQALQTILARQNLLIWAVFNLNEMLQNLPTSNGQRPKEAALVVDPEEEAHEQDPFFEQPEERPARIENASAADDPVIEAPAQSTVSIATQARREKRFGDLARRRRRGALAVLLAVLTGVALAATLNDEEGFRAAQEEPPSPSEETAQIQPEEPSTSLYQAQNQVRYATPEPSLQEDILSVR